MADTQRSVADVLALLADNSQGSISAQDLRDALVTWRNGHGQIYVAAADAAAITISDTTNYFEATAPAWTTSSGMYNFDESGGNGRLTYTGVATVTAHIACTISLTTAQNNRTIHSRLGISGTTDAAGEIQRRVSTATDVGTGALHMIATMSTGDYISLWFRNATSADNVTIEVANLQVITMPA